MLPVILAITHPVEPAPGASLDPAWIVALISFTGAVIAVLAWLGRWAWRIARRTTHFLDDFFGQPAHEGLPARPGVLARLGSLETLVNQVVSEIQPNHGESLRDAVGRIEKDVNHIKSEQAEMRKTQRGGGR